MRLLVFCHDCQFEHLRLGTEYDEKNALALYYAPIDEQRVAEFVCARGHKNRLLLEAQLFQVLFDYAVVAFDDGYTREAVASLAACLERFFEFATAAFLRNAGVSMDEGVEAPSHPLAL